MSSGVIEYSFPSLADFVGMALANPVFDLFPNTDGHLAAAVGFVFRPPGWNLVAPRVAIMNISART